MIYNHAGGFADDDQSFYFFERAVTGDNHQSLYCTSQGLAGGLSLALWNRDVRQFLISNAIYFRHEFHIDGFRYDEISALLNMNANDGWASARI